MDKPLFWAPCWYCRNGWHAQHYLLTPAAREACWCEEPNCLWWSEPMREPAGASHSDARDALELVGIHYVVESDVTWWRKGVVPPVLMQRMMLAEGVRTELGRFRVTRMRRRPDIIMREYAYIVDFDVRPGRGAYVATVYDESRTPGPRWPGDVV